MKMLVLLAARSRGRYVVVTSDGGVTELSVFVVCGFVEATQAVCWQYASRARRFIVVGRWRT